MNPHGRNDRIEQLVDRALREQPLRRAPADLQSRVWAEIERRATLPWWRKSFAYWPLPARILFFIASVGVVKAGLTAATWAFGPIESAALSAHLPPQVTWLSAVTASIELVIRSIPSLWLYGAITVFAAVYVVIFGVSAAAYRTLYAGR